MEKKKSKVSSIRDSRQNKPKFFHGNAENNDKSNEFIKKTKERLLERKRKEDINWEQIFYNYSAHKAKESELLRAKQIKLFEERERKKRKKQQKEKENQIKNKMNEEKVKKIYRHIKRNLKIQKKHSREKNQKNNSSEIKKKKTKEDFDIEKIKYKIQENATSVLLKYREERNKKKRDMRNRSKKLKRLQKNAMDIISNCKKKPFKPAHDFNDPNDIIEHVTLKEEKPSEDLNEAEDFVDDHVQMENHFQNIPKNEKKQTKVFGKRIDQKKILNDLKKKDLTLYKYKESSKNKRLLEDDIDEEDFKKAKKFINEKKTIKEIQNKKIVNINKVFQDAKMKNIPQRFFENKGLVDSNLQEENVIDKHLKDYKMEKMIKKKINNQENIEEDPLKLLGLTDPITEFQKEFANDSELQRKGNLSIMIFI